MKPMLSGKVIGLSSAIAIISGCQSFSVFDPEGLPPSATLPAASERGKVELRYFDNISGSSINNLTSNPAYPDNPSNTVAITSLEVRGDRGDNYGAMARGFIKPPSSGNYRFFVSGDDQVEFWLSTSDMPEDAKLIASVPRYTGRNQYNRYSSQTSPFQNLDTNKHYYFEIRHKEGNGGDHFSVAWEGPGLSQQVIGSSAIATWAQPSIGGTQSIQEAYSLGYRVGFLDGSEGLSFNPSYPPLDEDNDGIYDNWEIVHGLNPNDPNDANTDPDGDLLSAADEFLLGTAENNPDTDGDGIPDGIEIAFGLDPLDATDADQDLDGDGYSNLEEYLAGTNPSDPNSFPEVVPEPGPDQEGERVSGFAGQYFLGSSFNTFVLAKTDPKIDFNWGRGKPIPELPEDRFSVRWSGTFTAPHSSGNNNYEFIARTNDGGRLYRDSTRVINDWKEAPTRDNKYTTALAAGESFKLTMENFEGTGNAYARLTIRNTTTNQTLDTEKTVTSPDLTNIGSGGVDTDGDGIPDAWELAYGLNPAVNDASASSNNRGISNLEAYQSGLHPWTLKEVSEAGPGGGDKPSPPPVQPPPATSADATLSWTAPATRLDGSSIALSEIDYYIISYGRDRNNPNQTQRVSGENTSYVFKGLPSGTWYFSVKVFDSKGLSSAPSEVVSKTIQ